MLKRSVTVLAPAKLNLSLDVVGTLPNGYHDLDMVMQTIDLYEKNHTAPQQYAFADAAGQLCAGQR